MAEHCAECGRPKPVPIGSAQGNAVSPCFAGWYEEHEWGHEEQSILDCKNHTIKVLRDRVATLEAKTQHGELAMFSVRIDKEGDGYVFRTRPMEGAIEVVALDSTPAIIAMVNAETPGAACARAWDKASRMYDTVPGELPGDLLAALDKDPL
jgi:hypothetical protein